MLLNSYSFQNNNKDRNNKGKSSSIFKVDKSKFSTFDKIRFLKYCIKTSMQHSSDELIDFFFKPKKEQSPLEASQILQTLFQSPTILMSHISTFKSSGTQSSLDLKKIFELYDNIGSLGKDSDLLVLYNKTFNELVGDIFKDYLKSREQLKYFFVVILWDKLFRVNNYDFVTLRALQYIQRADQYKETFAKWLQDVPTEYLKLMVTRLHQLLEINLKILIEKPQTQQSNRQLSKKCETICFFMHLLFLSNKEKQRLNIKEFNNNFLTKFFQPIEQFKIYLESKTSQNNYPDFNFNFIKYPFLLDFDYKYKLIQIESIYEQKMNIKKNMERGLTALIQDFDFQGGQIGIEGLIYLCITVRRDHLLDDSMEKLGKVKQNLRSPLRIDIAGQEGKDQGGITNQFFALLTKEIFNPYLDMFIPKSNGRFYWFNGFSYEMPVRFEFVGMLLGLALYNGVHLDIHFPEITFKKLLNKNYEQDYSLEIVQDLKQIEPEIYRSLKDILVTNEPLDDLELYFNVQLESFGEIIVEELVEEGNQIKVNLDNREEYCLLYADFLLNKHIEKQFTPFRKGFYKVVEGGIFRTLEAAQLSVLINGKQQINIKELQESTTYQGGYTNESPVIKYLWEFLHTLTNEEKKNFLTFVTGTDRVPIDGLKTLKFNIQRHSNTKNLPTAHTCFNVLLLPEYESRQILEKNMRLILEHNQGFGLI